MSSGTNERRRVGRLLLVLTTVAVLVAPFGELWAEQVPQDDNAGAPAIDPALRRTVMRKVAVASLMMILLLIIFIVVVMIYSRRVRAYYLGWHRSIRFNKLWDVWWQKPGEKPKDGDKTAKG